MIPPTEPPLLLSAADIRQSLPMPAAVAAMRMAFTALSAGQAVVPVRAQVAAAGGAGEMLLMPAVLDPAGVMGVKVVTVFDRNPDRGLPRVQALAALYDSGSGRLLALLEGETLTALRTGAASGLATDLMARPASRTLACIGAGTQARTQLEAVCAVRPIESVTVYDPSPERARAFAAEMGTVLGRVVTAVGTAAEAVRGADIVCTATPAREPVLDDRDLGPGTHINAVGSYRPDMREIPVETLLRARVVVDHRASALAETGDLLTPIGQGLYSADRIAAELGDVATGRVPGRLDPGEVTLFKSVGVAIQDLVAGLHALQAARALGLGTPLRM